MNKQLIIALTIFLGVLTSGQASGQMGVNQPSNSPYERINNDRKPAPLPSIRQADVIWEKKLWRIIDLREKMNQPMFYPTEHIEDRYSLIRLLIKGIEEGKITAYDASADDEFRVPMTLEQVREAMGASTQKTMVRDFETGEMIEKVYQSDIRPEEVSQIMLKEVWFFDKVTSSLQVRIIGVCPIREYFRDDDVNQENVMKRQVFWINYPEARQLLSKFDVFNPFNDARSMSYDEMFIKRYFSSYIIKESNKYNNREISAYAEGQDIIRESERIKNDIFNWEQDLWEY